MLMDHLEYWEDKGGKVTLDELPHDTNNWKVNTGSLNFGFTRSAFWFRFELPPHLVNRETLILLFGYSIIDDVRLFMPNPDRAGYTVLKIGRNYPIAGRTVQTQDLALEIPLSHQLPGRTFYLRMQTQGSAQFPMRLMTFHEYFRYAYSSSLVYRLFMGSMLIMILYNLIFFLVTRLISYLIYVVFITCSTLFVMSTYGLAFLYIWPLAPEFNKISIPFFLGLSNMTLSIFNVVSLRRILRKKLTRNVLYFNATFGLLVTLSCFTIPYALSVRLATAQTMFTAILLPVIYVNLCREKYRPAYFYLLSIGSLALGAVVFGMKAFGFLPHNIWTEGSAMIASASQITLLTFALADQYRAIQKQNESMQKEMIEMQRENIRLLDQKVADKTRDVRVILSSIQQGIFTISGQPPRIDDEFSGHLESMFPEQTIAGRDPVEFLSAFSQLSGDEWDQIRSVIVVCLESHRFNFEINDALFPKQIIRQVQGQAKRILQVEWSPVLWSDESVGKILVALR